MRNNQPVTQREVALGPQQKLISATDARGVITYCNDAFVEISGFNKSDLIGAPQNIVRHPDVPSAVFAHMWSALKLGKPWMGIVKNRSKNGDHYWVNAYVTPIFEGQEVVGYESVRVKPTAEQSIVPKPSINASARASRPSRSVINGNPPCSPGCRF